MVTVAKRLIGFFDRINEIAGRAVSWLTLLLVILVSCDVAMRYIFSISFVAVQELEWHIFSIIFLIGAGYTLKQNGHVRVDLVYQRLSKRYRAWIDLLGCIFFLFPGCFLVIKTSVPFVVNSFQMHECSPDPGGLPARYILKSTIVVGFSMLMIQGASLFLKRLLFLLTANDTQEEAT